MLFRVPYAPLGYEMYPMAVQSWSVQSILEPLVKGVLLESTAAIGAVAGIVYLMALNDEYNNMVGRVPPPSTSCRTAAASHLSAYRGMPVRSGTRTSSRRGTSDRCNSTLSKAC